MGKLYGYNGRILRVNLTDGQISAESLDEETLRKWVGGLGIGAKYLYDEVPAGVAWNDPENRIIFACGPLNGTRISGSGTVSVITKGALTNGAVSGAANGFFGAYLKFAGYDGIVIQGQAKNWSYLFIHDGTAEIREAPHLAGKDTFETGQLIKKELGTAMTGLAVASIGPAGESGVRYASVVFDNGHTAAHGGMGAVMGSKKLKAVAVAPGKTRPAVLNGESVAKIADELHANVLNHPASRTISEYGTLNYIHDRVIAGDGVIPVKNYTEARYDIGPGELEKFDGVYIRDHYSPRPSPCFGCRMRHYNILTIPEGRFRGCRVTEPEYDSLAAFGPLTGNTDAAAAIFLSDRANRLGIDADEAGWTLGLAMECYEKGLISARDADGADLRWGNQLAADDLISRIAKRRGFGNVLAEGAMRAARIIGGDAPDFAVHTMRGNTPRTYDHRTRWPLLFDTCLSQTGRDEGFTVGDAADLGIAVRPNNNPNAAPSDTIQWNTLFKGASQFEDCLGVCRFCARTDIKRLTLALNAVTGWEFSAGEAMDAGRRIILLLRSFNIRCGQGPELDAPSPRLGSASLYGPTKGKSILTGWSNLRSRYYAAMGWDAATGKPLPKTLRKYGLEYLIREMWEESLIKV